MTNSLLECYSCIGAFLSIMILFVLGYFVRLLRPLALVGSKPSAVWVVIG